MKKRFFCLALFLFLAGCAVPRPSINATHVTLVADGARTSVTLESSTATVRDVLRQANVSLADLDRVRPPESVAISDGMTITVTRIIYATETQTQTVAFA